LFRRSVTTGALAVVLTITGSLSAHAQFGGGPPPFTPKADAKDEWVKWEQKLADYKVKADRTGDEAGDILEEKARVIAAELRDGIERLRKLV